MGKLSFHDFTWPENPESYQVVRRREPIFLQNEAGIYEFYALAGPKKQISGSGVFTGPLAWENFAHLEELMMAGTLGVLIQPNGEQLQAYLLELTTQEDGRADFVRYHFQFREADENGKIP